MAAVKSTSLVAAVGEPLSSPGAGAPKSLSSSLRALLGCSEICKDMLQLHPRIGGDIDHTIFFED